MKLELELSCEECGCELEAYDSGDGQIVVKPCGVCLKEVEDGAYDRGYEDGEQNCLKEEY